MSSSMKVLIACEWSGAVRDEFFERGHDVWSCDLLPGEGRHPYRHLQQDVRTLLEEQWDLIIAFPPCDHLAVSGARWFKDKRKDGRQQQGIDFFLLFTDVQCDKVCIENPVGIMSSHYRKPDQIIQPYQFGHPMAKKTCLWLTNLPPLKPTKLVEPDYVIHGGKKISKWYSNAPKKDRAKYRGITFPGVAQAMSEQWG